MEATILKWHKKVGDFVKHDETIVEIATDKVDTEVPSTEQGILTEILFQVNDVVPIGTVIARIQTSADTQQTAAPVQSFSNVTPISTPPPAFISPEPIPYTPSFTPEPETRSVSGSASSAGLGTRFYSPLVLNIANSEGISLSELERISGTGNDGRVSKRDVLQYVADKKAGRVPAYQAPVQYVQVPASQQPNVQHEQQAILQQPVYPQATVQTPDTQAAFVQQPMDQNFAAEAPVHQPEALTASAPPVAAPAVSAASMSTEMPVVATTPIASSETLPTLTSSEIPTNTQATQVAPGIITASYQPSNYNR